MGKPRTRYYSSEGIQVGLCLNNEAVMYSLLYALDLMGTGNTMNGGDLVKGVRRQ